MINEQYNLTEKDFQVGRYMRMTALSNALDAECKALTSMPFGDPKRNQLLAMIEDLHNIIKSEVYDYYKPILEVTTSEKRTQVEDDIPL